MSLGDYKILNEELIKKVQELKTYSAVLEQELVAANANFFDEREKRIKSEQKCLYIIEKLKKSINEQYKNALNEFEYGECLKSTPPGRPRKSIGRRSSMGVTTRSPLRSFSPEQNIITIEPVQPAPIIEELAGGNKSSTGSETQNSERLSNVQERTENTATVNNENTENESTTNSCISIVTSVGSVNNGVKNITEVRSDAIPSIHISNRRATQIWNCNTLTVRQHSPINPVIVANTIAFPDATSPTNSSSLDHLTVNFAESLCLHSTPRSSENVNQDQEYKAVSSNKTVENATLATSTSARPRRRCTPINLVEPSLMTKLRTEECLSDKRKSKKKKKQK